MPVTAIDPIPALVVIDLQKGLVAAHLSDAMEAVVGNAATLAGAFRRHGLPVFLINVTGRARGRTDAGWSARSTEMPVDWAGLIDELDAQPTDHLITKRRRSAFHDTGLDTHLRDLSVTQVVLGGVSTSAGVESTARSAADHGYHVVLATDAMFDPDARSHEHSVHRVFPRLGQTATSTEIIELLAHSR